MSFRIALCLLAPTVCLAASRRLTPADLTAFPEMTECALSPDGRTAAVVTASGNIALYPGGRLLTSGEAKDSSLRWSPDGSRIAFFRAAAEADLWIAEVATGRLTPVTKVVHSNFFLPSRGSNLAWSPDSRRLAFVGADPAIPAPAADPRVITRLQFKSRTEFSDNRREHIWIVDAAERAQPRPLTWGEFHEHSIDWHGGRIVFVSNRQPDPDAAHNYDLFTVDVESGVIRRLTETPGCEYAPAFSPDGRLIAYTATTRAVTTIDSVAEDAHVFVIPSSGGPARELNHALDRRSTSPRWAPDGRSVYFLAADRGRQLLYRVPVEGGEARPVFERNATINSYAPGPRPAWLAADEFSLAELYLGGQKLTENSRVLAGIKIVEPIRISYRSFDGAAIEGWFLPPADRGLGDRVPLLLSIHGGPHGMYGYWLSRNLSLQILAARGYAVVYLNPRGSAGYGQAFADGCVNDWGGGDFKDLMAGVDHILTRFPWLDPDRLGVLGTSYGGYMTNWIITQTPRFRAAVSTASISNLISFYGTSLYQDLIHAEFNGFPWEGDNFERLWQRSPLKHAARARTPTLFLHGERDHDVHTSDAEQMYVALRRQGVDAELVLYPREGHGFTEPRHRIDALQRTIEWFDRYLGKMSPPTRDSAGSSTSNRVP
jgi:dipeptidyl aminopeptidase/acylaminoacyl peptidase